MFLTLEAYEIPAEIVTIKTTYIDTSCIVSILDGDSDPFQIMTGILQGRPSCTVLIYYPSRLRHEVIDLPI